MPDLSRTLAIADATKALVICPCNGTKRLNKSKPPATPRPDVPKETKAGNPSFWEGHPPAGSRVFDIYIVSAADEQVAEEEYGMKGWGAYAWLNNNDAVFKEAVWPRILRPGRVPAPGMNFVAAHRVPNAFSNAFQEGVYIHEVVGHALHGVGHDSDHPSMHESENLPRGERLALMSEVHDRFGYTHIRVLPYFRGVMKKHDEDDLVFN